MRSKIGSRLKQYLDNECFVHCVEKTYCVVCVVVIHLTVIQLLKLQIYRVLLAEIVHFLNL